MVRSARCDHRHLFYQRHTPCPLTSCKFRGNKEKDCNTKRLPNTTKNDWNDVTCSVCMEFSHNAVLLLCSSHDKGCRPYMCGTGCRYSNCLEQFKNAYIKAEKITPVGSLDPFSPTNEKSESNKLTCPLCRGQVKGWTVVVSARKYLNGKERSCMQDNCSFTGTYKELRKHVKAEHSLMKPRQIDPILQQNWTRMENENSREDTMSIIRSEMPGSMVFGDYVIEGVSNEHGENNNRIDVDWFNVLFQFHAFQNTRGSDFSSGGHGFAARLRRTHGLHQAPNLERNQIGSQMRRGVDVRGTSRRRHWFG
ncbi:hypothetical protein ZOSMA_155G00170 [Zostera marina]|uniref:Uncharacterized protein n=1 Tax=Zostera marina TaxID=29655 RepID=A0A0K9PVP5_ZOSMR|nr:hypothetical protein ZOSMA_155G00170 [Zostera marina]